jgi:hypothetical protein
MLVQEIRGLGQTSTEGADTRLIEGNFRGFKAERKLSKGIAYGDQRVKVDRLSAQPSHEEQRLALQLSDSCLKFWIPNPMDAGSNRFQLSLDDLCRLERMLDGGLYLASRWENGSQDETQDTSRHHADTQQESK